MGILLPPVPQATVTILTLHHRNRSLDSALQRIPEVDVTPSPECETIPTPTTKTVTSIKGRSREREDLASLGSDDSGILCGSDSGSSDAANATTRESSVEHLHSRESLDSSLSQAGDMDSVDAVDGDESVVSTSPIDIGDPMEEQKDRDEVDCSHGKFTNNSIELQNGECSFNKLRDNQPCHNDIVGSSSSSNGGYQNSLEVAVQRELAGAAMTLCCGTGQLEDETVNNKQPEMRRQETAQPKPTEGCLLRLFESQVFDMSMAISYLFNSKEPGVQSYLGQLHTFISINSHSRLFFLFFSEFQLLHTF